jgi:hypothetical protein
MIVEMARWIVAATAVAVLAAGCGGHGQTQSDREWMANARGVVEQLRGDVLSVSGFDELATARRGLSDDSELYGLLVSYTDFGGCLHMVAAVGAEPPGRARVVELLHRACLHLQRADRLFTSAVERKEPHLLVTATREALSAVPVLDDAALELAK